MYSQVVARVLSPRGALASHGRGIARTSWCQQKHSHCLKGRPAFGKGSNAEKTKLCNALHQIPLSSTELAQVLDVVMTVGFAPEDLTSLVDAIADILGQQGTSAPMAKTSRSSMQSWETLVHFIPGTV